MHRAHDPTGSIGGPQCPAHHSCIHAHTPKPRVDLWHAPNQTQSLSPLQSSRGGPGKKEIYLFINNKRHSPWTLAPGAWIIPGQTLVGKPPPGASCSCKPAGTEVLISAVAHNKPHRRSKWVAYSYFDSRLIQQKSPSCLKPPYRILFYLSLLVHHPHYGTVPL